MKRCRICDEDKALTDFSPNRLAADGRRAECRDCRNRLGRLQYAGSERIRAQVRVRSRKNRYGVDVSAFDAILGRQGGTCALCKGEPSKKGWCVDHDHETGQVRGILCHPCNLLLGMAGDSVDRLMAAIQYLNPVPTMVGTTWCDAQPWQVTYTTRGAN